MDRIRELFAGDVRNRAILPHNALNLTHRLQLNKHSTLIIILISLIILGIVITTITNMKDLIITFEVEGELIQQVLIEAITKEEETKDQIITQI